ncbi:MAG TPA: type II secretion system secretin GspD, partial [Polyangiaceae bacterium]|nr:type II secretion system secretin GspD [Polyangiaceae bacterium]
PAPAPVPVPAAGAPGAVPDPEPPGASGPPPTSMDAIAKALDVPYKPKPGGHLVKFNLQDADLGELVNHISGLTGKRFIYGQKVRQIKVTVVSPTPVTLDEAYEAFLSILQANGMTVVPHGRFYKIVDTGGVVTETTPVFDRAEPVPDTDRFVTRLYRLRATSATEAANLLAKFKSKEADISVYEPGSLLILTDRGSNIQRLVRILEEIDVGGAGSQMWIEPINYGSAADMAKEFNEIFELNNPNGSKGAPGLMKVIADDKTNSLVIVGTEDAYLKLLELMKRVDIAPAASGKIRVLPLQYAMAEELAATMTQMLTGAKAQANANQPGAPAPVFEGEVRVAADKPTNSLVVTSSARDFAQIRVVVDQLDHARRQVFIDAVIMDVAVSRSQQLGLAYHGGATADLGGPTDTIILGGLDPLKSIAPTDPTQLQGLALGVRGPDIPGSNTFPGLNGLSIPAFGVVLNAIANSGDSNVLSTPHVIATDNTPAEIRIGENIPLQQNIGGFGLPNLAGLAGGAAGANPAAALGALGGLGGFGGFGGGFSQRQDVGTQIKVTPHINDKDQVRLEIQEEISEAGAPQGTIGAVPITQRRANTTTIVDDQQTVVIGGLMRDTMTKSKAKIPVLGDLPVLGFLFRSSKNEMRKTNLLLILTPYVIRDQEDLRKVFERKMQERQEFLDRYFVFEGGGWSPPRDYTRTNGLVEDIRKAYAELEERLRLEAESAPREKRQHEPTAPIDLPTSVKQGGPAPAAAPQQPRPPTARPRRPRTDNSPIIINPIARSVSFDREE